MASVDIGMSLMYAPHPSVVPFELAQNGAVVVTNTFANRDAETLRAMSGNIVPVEPRLDDIARGIVEAFRRVESGEPVARGPLPGRPANWEEALAGVIADLESEGFI